MPRRKARAQGAKNVGRIKEYRRKTRTPKVQAGLPATTQPAPDPTVNVGGKPPLLLDYRRGWLIIKEACEVIKLHGTDSLAARTAGVSYNALSEWREIGLADIEEMSDVDREELERCASMFMADEKDGGDPRPMQQLDENRVSRYAKYAACYRRAEALCILVGLSRLNLHANESWQATLAMFNRRFGKEYGEPPRRIAGPDDGNIPLGGEIIHRVHSYTVELPRNGYEPDSPVDPLADAKDDAAWATELARREAVDRKRREEAEGTRTVFPKRPARAGKTSAPLPMPGTLASVAAVARARAAAAGALAIVAAEDEPDTPVRRTAPQRRAILPPQGGV